MSDVYDFIAIGLGPFNLSLAALSAPHQDVNALFLEQRSEFDWHPGMMIDDVTLQTPFMSDLVTLADPTSRFSYLNYAKLHNRLYPFYIRESFFLLREEYNQYCQWVCSELNNIRFNHRVTTVTHDEVRDLYCVEVIANGQAQIFTCRHLVLGTGPRPYIPPCAQRDDERIFHSGEYLKRKPELHDAQRITIVGGGQSAAEIYYDLMQSASSAHINWITRSERYFPLEYTKLTLEMTSPEYVDYFYNLPDATRDELNRSQKNLYKGINGALINDIYDLLYRQNLSGKPRTTLKTHSDLVTVNEQTGALSLTFNHWQLGQQYRLDSDFVIMATGFSQHMPAFLSEVQHLLKVDNQNRFAVSRDYAIDREQKRIFVQNAEQHTHGFVTPDLGMACYRNSIILNTIAAKEVYPVEQKIAFQTFDLSDVTPVDTHGVNAA